MQQSFFVFLIFSLMAPMSMAVNGHLLAKREYTGARDNMEYECYLYERGGKYFVSQGVNGEPVNEEKVTAIDGKDIALIRAASKANGKKAYTQKVFETPGHGNYSSFGQTGRIRYSAYNGEATLVLQASVGSIGVKSAPTDDTVAVVTRNFSNAQKLASRIDSYCSN